MIKEYKHGQHLNFVFFFHHFQHVKPRYTQFSACSIQENPNIQWSGVALHLHLLPPLSAFAIALVSPCWSSAATTVVTFSLGSNVTNITRRAASASDLHPGTCTTRRYPELGKTAITDGLIAMDA
jgi:hypothetical protein